jgi:hypothetical protein
MRIKALTILVFKDLQFNEIKEKFDWILNDKKRSSKSKSFLNFIFNQPRRIIFFLEKNQLQSINEKKT